MLKLHLGCGPIIIPGWVNLDIGPYPGVTQCDLRNPLPYPDNSVDYIFSEHFIEHIDRPDGVKLFKECYRVLKPAGIIRTITPDLKVVATDYINRKIDRAAEIWAPLTPCQMMNGAMRLWDHKFLYDYEELRDVLKEAGFKPTFRMKQNYRQSQNEALRNIDQRPHHEELILEVAK